MSIIEKINYPQDLKKLNLRELNILAKEIRTFLIKNISKTGGHLASNLGIVEVTIAIHYIFNAPKDKIIWDVGHQTYVHKILTGRKKFFNKLRCFEGLSGFPRPYESEYDTFIAGHSSTSISAALGMAKARDLNKDDNYVLAVIGDGAMTGGLAYEAINNAGRDNTNIIVILNDNQMSISKNVGALSKHLNSLRTKPAYINIKKIIETILNNVPIVGEPSFMFANRLKDSIKHFFVPNIMFEELGFKYIGIVDGHNINELINVLKNVKNMKGPILIHISTKKGKGYKPAEERPWDYHGVEKFNIKTGDIINKNKELSYSDVFGNKLVKLAYKNDNIVAITAAMIFGTGLIKFYRKFPERFFDVGIAEQHAVTFAAGLAAAGKIPIFAVYSTFLQRAYDQIIHDVCIQKQHVIFAVDRAGIVGSDGETHQGLFDISYLINIPNITVLSPKNGKELEKMLEFAVNYNAPIAIRYPRGIASNEFEKFDSEIVYGKAEIIENGEKIAIISEGHMLEIALEVSNFLKNDGYNPYVINARFLKPIDSELILNISKKCNYIFTIEDNLKIGGFGSCVTQLINDSDNYNVKVVNFAFDDIFVEQGNPKELYKSCGLDSNSIYNKISSIIKT